MVWLKRTKYFVVTRVEPSKKDVNTFMKACDDIGVSQHGYHVTMRNGRKILRGFFILKDRTEYSCDIEKMFPNFLVTQMPSDMNPDLDGEDLPKELVLVGENPFRSLKANLFKQCFQVM